MMFTKLSKLKAEYAENDVHLARHRRRLRKLLRNGVRNGELPDMLRECIAIRWSKRYKLLIELAPY